MNARLGHQNSGCAALSGFDNLGSNPWRVDEGRISHLAKSALGQKPRMGGCPRFELS